MMAPEETEDLISKTQTKTKTLVLLSATTITVLFVSCFGYASLSVPKVEQIDHRLGPLVQEFKELVYPPYYNPDSKPAAKRKTGQSWSRKKN